MIFSIYAFIFSFASPLNPHSAHTREGGQSKRLSLLSQLAVPYNKLACRTPSPRARKKIQPEFPEPNGTEPEQRSDVSSDMTSDLTDVTSDITGTISEPPSPELQRDIEQGTLGGLVGACEGRDAAVAYPHSPVRLPFLL